MIFIALLFIFAAILIFVLGIVPALVARAERISQQKSAKFIAKYDAVLTAEQMKKSQTMILVVPPVLAVLALIFAPQDMKPQALVAGIIFGLIIPRMQLNNLISQRKKKFENQLMDALMIMSSSFRGGLSLIQALEAVADEMPDPLRQEFGIVLGENKMGVPLDESLNRLYKRMPSPGMQQMVTAVLLARETGGNLALIFTRIINSTRERRKIEQNLQTLTIQGKIQAFVMSGLPVLFYLGVSTTNDKFFDVMKNTPMGQKLLTICVVLWIIGALAIWKISTFKEI